MVTREAQVEVHYNLMRKPKVRVIAIADKRFRDPRNDGAVYAYLPTIASGDLIERMIDNAIDHIQLLHNRAEINEKLVGATREIHELNQIGAALSAEHDTGKLLEMILTKSREITQSDAGSLYLVEAAEGIEPISAPKDGSTVSDIAFSPDGTAQKLVQYTGGPKRLRFKLAQND